MKISKKLLKTPFLIAALCVFWGSSSWANVVSVEVIKDGKLVQKGLAAVIADQTIVVNNLLIKQGGEIKVVKGSNKLPAEILASSEKSDLVLLTVKELSVSPIVLAKEKLENSRKVYLQTSSSEYREGFVHSRVDNSSDFPFAHIKHTALVRDSEYGAPLLNNCKQLVGVSHNKKKGLFSSKLIPSKSFGVASGYDSLKSFLEANSIKFKTASDTCLSDSAIIDNLSKQKEKSETELEKVSKEKTDKEKELAKLAKEKESKAKALEKLEKEKKAKEKALAEAEKANKKANEKLKKVEKQKREKEKELKKVTKEKEEELKKANEEKAKKEKKIGEIEVKRAEESEAREKEKEKELYYAIGGGLLFLLALISFFVLSAKRKRRLQHIEDKNEVIESELSYEIAKNKQVSELLKKESATFEDLIFVGNDEEGTEHRLKIDGNTLARAETGVVIGRSAQNAKFVLNVPGISRMHLKMTLVDGEVVIEDLGSSNGTSVNGKELNKGQSMTLSNGDKLRIGTVDGVLHFLTEA